MTWTIAKIAVAGVLTAMPIAAVGIPACAAASQGDVPLVLRAPPPAEPPVDPPGQPAPHGEYYNPSDSNDWSTVGDTGGGGGGG